MKWSSDSFFTKRHTHAQYSLLTAWCRGRQTARKADLSPPAAENSPSYFFGAAAEAVTADRQIDIKFLLRDDTPNVAAQSPERKEENSMIWQPSLAVLPIPGELCKTQISQ